MIKVGIIIQARTKSTRLPNKIIKPARHQRSGPSSPEAALGPDLRGLSKLGFEYLLLVEYSF